MDEPTEPDAVEIDINPIFTRFKDRSSASYAALFEDLDLDPSSEQGQRVLEYLNRVAWEGAWEGIVELSAALIERGARVNLNVTHPDDDEDYEADESGGS